MISSAGSRAISSPGTAESPLAATARTVGARRSNAAGSSWCRRSSSVKFAASDAVYSGGSLAAASTAMSDGASLKAASPGDSTGGRSIVIP
jgi:hypothetical protein